MRGPLWNPKLGEDIAFANSSGNSAQPGQKVRREPFPLAQSMRNTWLARSPLGRKSAPSTSPVSGFHGVAVGADAGVPRQVET